MQRTVGREKFAFPRSVIHLVSCDLSKDLLRRLNEDDYEVSCRVNKLEKDFTFSKEIFFHYNVIRNDFSQCLYNVCPDTFVFKKCGVNFDFLNRLNKGDISYLTLANSFEIPCFILKTAGQLFFTPLVWRDIV